MGSLLPVVHLLGLALATGAATVKVAMALRSTRDTGFVRTFLASRKLLASFIILGLLLATVSGVIWLLQGYSWSPRLIGKVIVVGMIWLIGPVIDNVIEPKLDRLAPVGDEPPTAEFKVQQRLHLTCEIAAAVLMYVVFVLGSQL
jgi:hypothetical protein